MGGQVLDDFDVAADEEQAAGIGPDQGRTGSRLRLVLVVFLGLFLRGLNDVERQSVERFRGDLGAGLLGLLGARSRTSSSFFSFSPASAMSTPADGEVGIVATDRGDRQGALRELEQLFDAHADPFLEGLGCVFQPLRQLVAEILEAGSFQSWPYWLLRNDSRNDLTSFSLSKKSVVSGRIRSGGAAA